MSERWKPEDDQKYYFVNNMLTVSENNYIKNYKFDDLRYQNGNCFKTEAEAQAAAEKVKTLLLSLPDNGNNLVSNLPDKKQPKLTAEVFDRSDCPDWAKYAAVDYSGLAYYFSERPFILSDEFGWGVVFGENTQSELIPGKFTHINWRDSLVECPAKLPDWVEIGGYVYDDRNGYGKIVSGSVKSCRIEFNGGAGDFVPEAFAELKQARLRPYNAEELENLVGKVIKTTGQTALVIGFIRQSSRIVCGLMNNYLSGENLLDMGVTIDGKPAGVLEHLEDGEWVE